MSNLISGGPYHLWFRKFMDSMYRNFPKIKRMPSGTYTINTGQVILYGVLTHSPKISLKVK